MDSMNWAPRTSAEGEPAKRQMRGLELFWSLDDNIEFIKQV